MRTAIQSPPHTSFCYSCIIFSRSELDLSSMKIFIRITLNLQINLKDTVFIIHLFPCIQALFLANVFHLVLLIYFIVMLPFITLLFDDCLSIGRRGKAMKMMIMSQRNPNMRRYVIQSIYYSYCALWYDHTIKILFFQSASIIYICTWSIITGIFLS